MIGGWDIGGQLGESDITWKCQEREEWLLKKADFPLSS